MDLQLLHLAIHQMPLDFELTDASPILSSQLLPIDEAAEKLVQRLYRSFSAKSDVVQGQLASPEDALFPGYLHELAAADFTDEAFLQFSRSGMETLEQNARESFAGQGDYWVFAHFIVDQVAQVGVFMLQDTEGLQIEVSDKHEFFLQAVRHLQLDQLGLACRINLPEYWSADVVLRAELTRHGRQQRELPEYFLNWVAFESSATSRELTDTFLDAVAQLAEPHNEETGEPVDAGAFREQVAQFATRSPSNTISVKAFDQNFYGEETQGPLQTYLESNDIPLDEEFRFDRRAMRDYHFHRLKTKGMYFGCRHSFLLSGKVRVEGNQLVIDDEDLAEQIRELL